MCGCSALPLYYGQKTRMNLAKTGPKKHHQSTQISPITAARELGGARVLAAFCSAWTCACSSLTREALPLLRGPAQQQQAVLFHSPYEAVLNTTHDALLVLLSQVQRANHSYLTFMHGKPVLQLADHVLLLPHQAVVLAQKLLVLSVPVHLRRIEIKGRKGLK